ncbi:MAG: four helix bundle protein [Gemmatimonadaceae bacterium]
MSSFRDLLVWQKAHALSLMVSRLSEKIRIRSPGLAKQLERAAEAIASHIAEGRGRGTDPDFSHFLSMAKGSANEVENGLQKAVDYDLIAREEHELATERTIEVRKMIIGLKRAIDGRPKSPPDEIQPESR